MNKNKVLDEIKKFKKFKSDTDFAKFLGITPQVLSNWRSRNTYNSELIYTKCLKINPSWLLTGKGDMLKKEITKDNAQAVLWGEAKSQRIPLVSHHAAAGFGTNSFAITEQDVKEYYVIPKFRHNKVDFMIEVRGNSMYPKYNSGDVIACTILKESNFIQLNKPHLVATKEQGLLVKRILEEKEESFVLKSDNKEYPNFEVPKEEITGIAIVIGVIRLE